MIDVHNLYTALVESSDDAIVAKDVDGIVQSWNPAAERLFGYDAAEMVGRSIRLLLPPDRQDEEDLILARIRSGERVSQFFTQRMHKSGRRIEVSITVSPVRDEEGRIVGASKIARDVGPLLDSQRRLRDSEHRFRMMADSISQLAWIAEGDGSIHWYNQRWYNFTGATPEDMRDWGWQKFHHPDHLERVKNHYVQAIEAGAEWEDTFPLRRHDGEWRWFLSRAKPIRASDEDGGQVECWFGTNTDITEEREQAEQIRLLLMEVNHRSKNLLGTVQALARRTASHDAVFIKRFEDRIRSLAVNQDILVKREWRQIPLRELAEAQLAFIEQAPGDLSIMGPDLLIMPRAAETIGMALHELATNALKYGSLSVEGGHVDIGWRVDELADNAGFSMWWRETGGPPVQETGHAGFGSRLIREVPRHNLGAEVSFTYPPTGVIWEITCPLDSVSRASGILT